MTLLDTALQQQQRERQKAKNCLTTCNTSVVILAQLCRVVHAQCTVSTECCQAHARHGLNPCSCVSTVSATPTCVYHFTGIKAIKLYAWEQSFKERILSLRHLELIQIRHVAYLDVIQSLVFGCTPIMISLAAFAVYTAQGYALTPAVAFPALALFNLLRFPITMLPWYLMEFINGWVALGRIQRFMQVSHQLYIACFAADLLLCFCIYVAV